jgi:D-alanyl-D-alanine carboxypeptidase (penicillin-binding protein 5/6)
MRKYATIFTYKMQGVFMLKRILALVCAFFIVIVSASCANTRANAVLHEKDSIYAIAYSDKMHDIGIKSRQGFVYDVQNGRIVFTKGKNKVVYPGSTSKLITALYALSVLPADKVITAGDELDFVKQGSSIAYIKKGHRLTVEMLVEAMMIPSGNDAAYVLAAAVGREIKGSDISSTEALEAFTVGVNKYTNTIGLCGTLITVPDGYADEAHYTTTEDMAIIAIKAMDDPIISKYAGVYTDDVRYASGEINTWINTNKLLDKESKYYSPYAVGLKTGSISGEYSLLFSFRFDDGREYIAGVFGADGKNDRFEDANTIINYLKEKN